MLRSMFASPVGRMLARLMKLDHESRGGNRFASAAGAPARPGQAGSFAEDIAAIVARGGRKLKAPGSIMGERSHDVKQMMFYVAFRDAEQGSQLIRRP